jgi:phospholipid/cholesterol/gamma-HCH transport system substrate-binding protein
VREARRATARLLTIAGIVFAVAALALLLFRSGGSYEVTLDLENASQLVKGNEVKVGGIPVGVITSVDLTENYQARVGIRIEDGKFAPLHRGTRASVLFDSLTSVAGRYIAITPGPSNAQEIPDGGRIGADQTRAAIDPDQVLQTIDSKVQKDLRLLLRRSPTIFEGRAGDQANAGFEALNPALAQSTSLAIELNKDQTALRRLLTQSADVVSALASRPDDLEQLTGNALQATNAVADHTSALDSILAQLPPTLRRTNTTLVNLRSTLRDLRPLVRETRPAARPLAQVLLRLQPITRNARPVVARLLRTVRRPGGQNDLLDALRGVLPVAREGVPAFRSTTRLLRELRPIVNEIRPYTPDLGGLANGFGATSNAYYDANGRYIRIGFYGSLYTLNDSGTLVPLPSPNGLTGTRRNVLRRCPGAATQRLPDKSNPYIEDPRVCNPADTPR